tara:strand:+ start:806 stop:1009 length:204 start_codon:yes stop_codon:yes gene_type:complete
MIEYKRLLREALDYAKSNGLRVADIAKLSGVSHVTISLWLNGKSVPTILNLAAVINACGKQLKLRMT